MVCLFLVGTVPTLETLYMYCSLIPV